MKLVRCIFLLLNNCTKYCQKKGKRTWYKWNWCDVFF